MSRFEALGGLKSDLEAIVTHGEEAAALNQSQGAATRAKELVTGQTLKAFNALQLEYASVMNTLAALRAELTNDGETDNLKKLKSIMASEAQTTFTTQDLDGVTKKKARRLYTQESIRAEIERDAQSLLDFTEIASRLAARRVDSARLQKLKADAQALAGKVMERVATASERKLATQKEYAAVAAQSLHWSSVWRILSVLARSDVQLLDIVKVTKQ